MDKLNDVINEKKFIDGALDTIQYAWLLEHMDMKYHKRKYRDYVVNYLLIHYACSRGLKLQKLQKAYRLCSL